MNTICTRHNRLPIAAGLLLITPYQFSRILSLPPAEWFRFGTVGTLAWQVDILVFFGGFMAMGAMLLALRTCFVPHTKALSISTKVLPGVAIVAGLIAVAASQAMPHTDDFNLLEISGVVAALSLAATILLSGVELFHPAARREQSAPAFTVCHS